MEKNEFLGYPFDFKLFKEGTKPAHSNLLLGIFLCLAYPQNSGHNMAGAPTPNTGNREYSRGSEERGQGQVMEMGASHC